MIGILIIAFWYIALTITFAFFFTGGEIGKMGMFAAGFGTCAFGIFVAAMMASASISGMASSEAHRRPLLN